MVQTLESIKGGGGSIRVGTTGTIGSLMIRELESMKCAPQTPISSRRKPPTVPVSVPCSATTPKRVQTRRASSNDASSSSSNGSINNPIRTSPGSTHKTRHKMQKNTHHIPMLGSEDIVLDRTPMREKPDKKGSYIVEVVDLKCGKLDKAWSSPITNRLKKLSFSKLSETIG